MKHELTLLLVFAGFGAMGINIQYDGSQFCPIGFAPYRTGEESDNRVQRCWKIKPPETHSEKFKNCLGNRVPTNLSELEHDSNLREQLLTNSELFWTDYIRSYDNGPYVNWGDSDQNDMGHPNLQIDFEMFEPSFRCLAYRFLTKEYVPMNCSEKASRICMVGITKTIDVQCPSGYIPFANPIMTCVLASVVSSTARNVSTRLNFNQAKDNCAKNQGHLLQKGYIYAHYPALGVASKVLPLGIRRSGNDFLWMDLNELISKDDWNFSPGEDFNVSYPNVLLQNQRWELTGTTLIYNNVLCEYFIEPLIPVLNLYQEDDQLILFSSIRLNDIRCFTDSITYYPTPVPFDRERENNEYIIKSEASGYYWCIVINNELYNPSETKKVLFLKNESDDPYRYSVMIRSRLPFDESTPLKLDLIELVINRFILTKMNNSSTIKIDGEAGHHDVSTSSDETTFDDSYFDEHPLFFEIKSIQKIYSNGHVLLSADLFPPKRKEIYKILVKSNPISFKELDIIYFRNKRECSEQRFHLNETGTEFKKFEFNDTILLDNCVAYICTGNFDVGLDWDRLYELEKCDTTTKTTTESIVTVTKKPSDQVTNLANTLQQIVNSSSISKRQLQAVSDQVNEVLNFGKDIQIPKTILEDLDKIVSKVEIPENETQVKIVQPNIGIIVAKRSDSKPIAGISVAKLVNGFENNSINTFDSGEINQMMTNASEIDLIVSIASIMVANNETKFSFLVFKNDNAFSNGLIKNSQSVNSKVLSVSIGNETVIEKEEYIDIHLRPYKGFLTRNESKFCAYWDFNLGTNGNWSTEGCQLLKTSNIEGFDTCRCNHLTHFAEIIRFNGKVGDLDEIALSIISYVGCTLSLIGLFMIALTGTLFKAWRKEFSNKIWLHLSGAVALLILTFLTISIIRFDDQNKGLCVLFAVSLHYSLLASFCWMLISAVLSYQRLVTVFSKNSSHRLLKSCLFGWLAPIVPIILLFSISSNPYPGHWEMANIQRKFCFPDGIGFWLSIFMPVVIIVMANSFLFMIIIYSVFISTSIQRHGDAKQLYRSLTVSFLLFFLFGISWVFGLFMDHIVLTYIFCIMATIQGFILFIFFILGNKKTREMWFVVLGIKSKNTVFVTSSASTNKRSVSNEKNMPLRNINKPRSMTGNTNNFDARFS